MKKTMIGFAICALLLGCFGCSKEKEIDLQGTGIEMDEKDRLQEEAESLIQPEVTDSESTEDEENLYMEPQGSVDSASTEPETPSQNGKTPSEEAKSSVEPVYFEGDEMEVREQKLKMAKDNPYRKIADDYFEQVLEVGGPNNYFYLFETDTVYYTAQDFAGCSEGLLKLAKNEIYARHGRMFIDEDLYEYFLTRMWYEPTYTPEEFDESCFNDCEKANLKLLLELGA